MSDDKESSRMDKKMVKQIRENMINKTDDELLQIWKENDHERWSGSAFEAIRQILIDRKIELPPQNILQVKPKSTIPIEKEACKPSSHIIPLPMNDFGERAKQEIEKNFKTCTVKGIYLMSSIPAEKLSNAKATFASNLFRPTETPLLLVDCTTFGSCKSGLLITDEGIYAGYETDKWRLHWLEIELAEDSGPSLKLNDNKFNKIILPKNLNNLVAQSINTIVQTISCVVFPVSDVYPSLNCCVGCSASNPGHRFLASAAPLPKGKNLVVNAAGKIGGIGLGLALGPIWGGLIYNLPSLFKSSGLNFYYFPICRDCKNRGSHLVHLVSDGESIAARFINAQYADALQDSLNNPIPENSRVIAIDAERKNEKEKIWGRQLSARAAVIVDAWSEISDIIEEFKSYPKISDKKLATARERFWKTALDAPVIALRDATVLGSCKTGLLITTEGLHWNLDGETQAIEFLNVVNNPYVLSEDGKHMIVIDSYRLSRSMLHDTLLRIVAFLRYAVAATRINCVVNSDNTAW